MYIIYFIGKVNNWGWIKIILKVLLFCYVFVDLYI